MAEKLQRNHKNLDLMKPGLTTRAVVCLRNRDEVENLEDKDDCFILDFDPSEELNSFSNLSVSNSVEPDLQVLSEKGKVACRDYPHSRHSCAKFPFRTMPHESHCEMCYCYVCDFAAPCKKWVGKARHCDAYDNEKWSIKRKLRREAVQRKKEAYKGCRHPRYMCMEYPFESTPHDSFCKLCYCYVCEFVVCEEWAGTTGHCHAFNNEIWRAKRELKRHRTVPLQGQGTVTNDHFEEAKLYLGHMPDTVSKNDLETFFKSAGVVKKCEFIFVKCPWSVQVRQIGFVTMSTVEEAEKAVALFNGRRLHGMPLEVERCVRESPPHGMEVYSIYVSNLTQSVDDKHLGEIFRERGYQILQARVVLDMLTKRSSGYGFVVMCRASEREDAIKKLNGLMVNGNAMKATTYGPN